MIFQLYQRMDPLIVNFMNRWGIAALRFSLGVIFIWFGALKLFQISPAIDLATKTVYWVDPQVFIPLLSWWEILIGVLFLIPKLTRVAIFLLAPHMVGTFMPLFVLPEVVFQSSLFHLTLEGQYIVKNLIIISSALVIGSHARDQ